VVTDTSRLPFTGNHSSEVLALQGMAGSIGNAAPAADALVSSGGRSLLNRRSYLRSEEGAGSFAEGVSNGQGERRQDLQRQEAEAGRNAPLLVSADGCGLARPRERARRERPPLARTVAIQSSEVAAAWKDTRSRQSTTARPAGKGAEAAASAKWHLEENDLAAGTQARPAISEVPLIPSGVHQPRATSLCAVAMAGCDGAAASAGTAAIHSTTRRAA